MRHMLLYGEWAACVHVDAGRCPHNEEAAMFARREGKRTRPEAAKTAADEAVEKASALQLLLQPRPECRYRLCEKKKLFIEKATAVGETLTGTLVTVAADDEEDESEPDCTRECSSPFVPNELICGGGGKNTRSASQRPNGVRIHPTD